MGCEGEGKRDCKMSSRCLSGPQGGRHSCHCHKGISLHTLDRSATRSILNTQLRNRSTLAGAAQNTEWGLSGVSFLGKFESSCWQIGLKNRHSSLRDPRDRLPVARRGVSHHPPFLLSRGWYCVSRQPADKVTGRYLICYHTSGVRDRQASVEWAHGLFCLPLQISPQPGCLTQACQSETKIRNRLEASSQSPGTEGNYVWVGESWCLSISGLRRVMELPGSCSSSAHGLLKNTGYS